MTPTPLPMKRILLWIIPISILFTGSSIFSQPTPQKDQVDAAIAHAKSLIQSDPTQAEDTLNAVIGWGKVNGLPRQVGVAYQLLTRIHTEKGSYKEAINAIQAGMDIFQELGDKQEENRMILYMGLVHKYLKLYDLSIQYYQEALEMAQENNHEELLGSIYGNMGNVYFLQGEYEKAKQVHLQSLALDEMEGDLQGIGNTYHNLGMLYEAQSNFSLAETYYLKSLEIDKKLHNLQGPVLTLMQLSSLSYEQEDFTQALSYAEKALGLTDSLKNLRLRRHVLAQLPIIHAARGDIETSLHFQKEYSKLNDSLQTSRLEQEIAQVRTELEVSQQEKELELQQITLSSQAQSLRLQRIALIGFSLAILLALGVIYLMVNRNRLKQRNLKLAQTEAQQIKKLDQLKSQFFTNISHEFRTPLHLILAPLQKKRTQITDRDIRMIERNGHRLLRLVNQMLDLGKLEMGMFRPLYRQVHIFPFLTDLLHSFIPLAQNKGITLQIDIPNRERVGWIDPEIIEKIVFNLVSNAVKYTPPEGKVSFHAHIEAPHGLRIVVSDTGLGVPPHMKEKIFERFIQTLDSAVLAVEGTGIGLALTKELVEICEGNISLDSEQGKGSSFTVLLPLPSEKPEGKQTIDSPPISSAISGLEPKPLTSSKHVSPRPTENRESGVELPAILVVEDHQELREHLVSQLQSEFEVREAQNGEEGLQLAKKHIPDLIITDLMMPLMDGAAMTQQLKRHPLTSHIPLIMLTAKDDTHSRKEGFSKGIDQYLSKPFHIEELKARMKSILTQRKEMREKYSREVVVKPSQVTVPDTEGIFLEELISIIEKHIMDESFTVEALQKKVGMSRMQLHRKLKALTGQSASEFIRTIRLKRAAQLLEDSHMQVAEAAYQSGFGHLSYFSKCFKEQYGILPSEFAKKTSQKA